MLTIAKMPYAYFKFQVGIHHYHVRFLDRDDLGVYSVKVYDYSDQMISESSADNVTLDIAYYILKNALKK